MASSQNRRGEEVFGQLPARVSTFATRKVSLRAHQHVTAQTLEPYIIYTRMYGCGCYIVFRGVTAVLALVVSPSCIWDYMRTLRNQNTSSASRRDEMLSDMKAHLEGVLSQRLKKGRPSSRSPPSRCSNVRELFAVSRIARSMSVRRRL